MKALISVEFGKDSWGRGMEEINYWNGSYNLTEHDKQYYGKNVFIQTAGQIIDLPLIGWQESEAVYNDILQSLEYDPDCNIFRMFAYVEKQQDDYTGLFSYRKQGPTKAVPACYVLIDVRFTEEVDVTKRVHMSILEDKKRI